MSVEAGNILKILLLGDSSVGKTCFLMRYADSTFQEVHMSTVGLDYRLKDMVMEDQKQVTVQIWDTAGQDRFRAITKNYYKGADGIVLIYDVTSRDTFQNITTWITQIKENASTSAKIIIVGNKIDMTDQIKVSTDEISKLASENNLKFIEASAKNNIRIDECFNLLVNDIYKDYEIKKKVEAQKLESQKKTKKRRWC